MHQGVHRIIGLWEAEFDIAGLQPGIFCAEIPDHIVPVVVVQKAALLLKRIVGGDHQPEFFEVGVFHQVVCQDEMADVDRVEGAEKESDFLFHYSGFFTPMNSATSE